MWGGGVRYSELALYFEIYSLCSVDLFCNQELDASQLKNPVLHTMKLTFFFLFPNALNFS